MGRECQFRCPKILTDFKMETKKITRGATSRNSISTFPVFEPIPSNADTFDRSVTMECKDGVCPVPWAVTETAPVLQGDNVNHPPHYTDGGIECIEAIEAALTAEEFRGYCKGNLMKYNWRERMKGGTESLKKAQWYLDRLIQFDEVQKG